MSNSIDKLNFIKDFELDFVLGLSYVTDMVEKPNSDYDINKIVNRFTNPNLDYENNSIRFRSLTETDARNYRLYLKNYILSLSSQTYNKEVIEIVRDVTIGFFIGGQFIFDFWIDLGSCGFYNDLIRCIKYLVSGELATANSQLEIASFNIETDATEHSQLKIYQNYGKRLDMTQDYDVVTVDREKFIGEINRLELQISDLDLLFEPLTK
ncbi:MAG: hypothetical protein OHK0017_11290 [Patescibacteria group bacterium]